MKQAFSLIELIFVIIIIGILAAVALPKFVGIGEQAHVSNLKNWVATLNNTVGPELWSKSLAEGKGGKISDLNTTEGATFLEQYTDIPKEIVPKYVDLTQCSSQYNEVAASEPLGNASDVYTVVCKDGDASHAPKFELLDPNGKVIAGD